MTRPEQNDSDLLLCVRGEITSEEYVRRLRARVAEPNGHPDKALARARIRNAFDDAGRVRSLRSVREDTA